MEELGDMDVDTVDIGAIIDSGISDEEKLGQLLSVISSDKQYQIEGDWNNLIQIIQFEKSLINGDDELINEQSLKLLQLKIRNNNQFNDFFSNYVNIKFQDLYSDWQLLINDDKLDKIIDLINKKILLIKNNSINLLNFQLYYKIFYLLIISPTDFRKSNIITFLDNCSIINFNQYDIYKSIKYNRLISPQTFRNFISNNINEGDGLYSQIFKKIDFNILLKNLLENNLICLTKYYQSINFSKVYNLLQITPQICDLSSLITSMIVANKFPGNCKIDDLNKLIIFNDHVKNDSNQKKLNDHILQIGTLMTDIVNQMKP